MNQAHIIDIEEARTPYNTHMVLPLLLLQQLMPVIREEMMKGLISNDDQDRVILHLNLSAEKIAQVNSIAAQKIDQEA